jgi:hypothetical protein
MSVDAPPDAGEMRQGKRGERIALQSLDDLDRRRSSYQRTRILLEALEAESSSNSSTGRRQLAMRAACHGAMLADLEVRYLKGEQVDVGIYTALTNSQRRLICEIYSPALRSQPKEINPLDQHLLDALKEEFDDPQP